MATIRVKLTKERQTKNKTVYSDDLDLLGTVYVSTAQIQQITGGTVPEVLYAELSDERGRA